MESIRKTREAEQAHSQEKAAVLDEANRAALRDRAKRVQVQRNLEEASSGMRSRIETARENALKLGNEKYSTVNEALSPLPADMEAVHRLYGEASDSPVKPRPSLLC